MSDNLTLEPGTPSLDSSYRIDIDPTGPYLVWGRVPIRQQFIVPNEDGYSWSYKSASKPYETGKEPVALCRCGASKTKPYCDGSHLHAAWDPRLTAPHERLLESAESVEGSTLKLTDNPKYCAFARFCDAYGRVWNIIDQSDEPEIRELAIREANYCPAGRLKAWDQSTGKALELDLKPGIGIIEDPAMRVSAGLWVKGGVPIHVKNGATYEVRNRVTLCRCGQSSNKPFCDGTHVSMKFHDGLPDVMDGEECR